MGRVVTLQKPTHRTGESSGGAKVRVSPADLYLMRLSPGSSRSSMRRMLNLIAVVLGAPRYELIDWGRLRYPDVIRILSSFAERGKAPATQRLAKSALKGVFRESRRAGLIASDDYHIAVDDLPLPRGERLPVGRAMETAEVLALFRASFTRPAPWCFRDTAILAMFCATGMRRGELVKLEVPKHYNPETGDLRISGKLNRERLGYVQDPQFRRFIATWLGYRGDGSGYLFCKIRAPSGRIEPSADLSGEHVRAIVKKLAYRAGIAPIGTHDFRRTVLTRLITLKVDLDTVRQLAGHTSINTTIRYRRGEAPIREAAALLGIFAAEQPAAAAVSESDPGAPQAPDVADGPPGVGSPLEVLTHEPAPAPPESARHVRERVPARQPLSRDQFERLWSTVLAETSLYGVRNAAVVGLLYSTGLPARAVVELELKDYDREGGRLATPMRQVAGQRCVYALDPLARDVVTRWLEVRGTERGPLVCAVDQFGRVLIRRLSPSWIQTVLDGLCDRAGIPICSPTNLRRTALALAGRPPLVTIERDYVAQQPLEQRGAREKEKDNEEDQNAE